MKLRSRLKKLEQYRQKVQPDFCACCGADRHGRPGPATRFKVLFADDPETSKVQEHCPECGAKIRFRLEFTD